MTSAEVATTRDQVDLSGRVALVTGASSGLGRRFAFVLASHGARVVATGRREERLAELASEIAAGGGTCHPVPVDITDAAQLVAMVERADREVGTVSILVNSAGVIDLKYATKMSIERIDRAIATNLRAPFILSCEVARRLIERQIAGRIINISSLAAYHHAGDGAALYAITKAGLDRMTETLSVEWSKFGINVNSIAPGAFRTEMLEGMMKVIGDVTDRFPRRRIGTPSQLDSTLLYLVSPASEVVTGTVIKADDGQNPR